MSVDASRRFEVFAAFEQLIGDDASAFMVFLHDVANDRQWQRWNYERFRRQPERTYRLYGSLRRNVGPAVAQTVMEILDPIGAKETWPVPPPDAVESVAAGTRGGDHGAG